MSVFPPDADDEGPEGPVECLDDLKLHSVDEAIEILGIGRTKIYEEIKSGHLSSLKYGRRRLIPRSVLRERISQLSGS